MAKKYTLGQRVFTWQGWGKISFIRYDQLGKPTQLITKLSTTGERGKWTNISGVRKSKPKKAKKSKWGIWEW